MPGFDIRRLMAAFRRRPGPRNAYERGVVALETGDLAGAVREFNTALAVDIADDATRARAHNKRGVALIGLARRAEALAEFSRALELDAALAPALVNVGNLLLDDGHVQDAIDYYEAALRSDARYAPAYRNLGAALRRLGRRAESVRALRSADRLSVLRDPRA